MNRGNIILIKDVLNTNISTKTLMDYQKIISRLKYNDVSHLTKPSKQVITDVMKRYSQARIPVNNIGELMTLLYKSPIRNLSVDYLLTKLYSLREQRLIYRLIKSKRFDLKAFLLLNAMIDNDNHNMFTAPHLKRIHDRKTFMDWIFTVKAGVIFKEMEMLSYVQRYWNRHRPTNNYHRDIYRCWW